MADICDIAQDRMEVELDRSLEAIRRAPRELEPTGECHFCKQEVGSAQLFCDSDCEKDYRRLKHLGLA